MTMLEGQELVLPTSQGPNGIMGIGFSKWGQEVVGRLQRATTQEEREQLAGEVRDRTLRCAQQITKGQQNLFETLIILERSKLYQNLGYETLRGFWQNELRETANVHRTTMLRMEAAVTEYMRLEDRGLTCAEPQYSKLCLLAKESERQQDNRGQLESQDYEELCRRVAAGEVTRAELAASLRPKKKGGSRIDPPVAEEGVHRCTPEDGAQRSGGRVSGMSSELDAFVADVLGACGGAVSPKTVQAVNRKAGAVLPSVASLRKRLEELAQHRSENEWAGVDAAVREQMVEEFGRLVTLLESVTSKLKIVAGGEIAAAGVEVVDDAVMADEDFIDPFEDELPSPCAKSNHEAA